jgi:hypothetical protein
MVRIQDEAGNDTLGPTLHRQRAKIVGRRAALALRMREDGGKTMKSMTT